MAVTSRTPAFLKGLRDVATTAVPSTTPVLYALAQRGGELPEAVLVGASDPNRETAAANGTQEWAAIGQHSREEKLNAHLLIVVQTGADDGESAVDRAYELLGLIEAALVTDPTVGGVVRVAAVATHDLTLRANDRGWAALLHVVVAGEVRLTP